MWLQQFVSGLSCKLFSVRNSAVACILNHFPPPTSIVLGVPRVETGWSHTCPIHRLFVPLVQLCLLNGSVWNCVQHLLHSGCKHAQWNQITKWVSFLCTYEQWCHAVPCCDSCLKLEIFPNFWYVFLCYCGYLSSRFWPSLYSAWKVTPVAPKM